MAKFTAQQNSFTAGEWSPALYGRNDLGKYYNACKTLKNFIVHPHGGASNRPGTEFLWEHQEFADHKIRLIPFQVSLSDAYVIALTYTSAPVMRVFKGGSLVKVDTGLTVTDISLGSSKATVTAAGHSFVDGSWVYIEDVFGTSELNGHWWYVSGSDGNTFDIPLKHNNYTAYTSGGTLYSTISVSIPWLEADLADLKYIQSADTLYVFHEDYAPRKITRTSDTSWTITETTFDPDPGLDVPRSPVASTTSGDEYYYVITAVDTDGIESDPTAPVRGYGDSRLYWTAPSNGNQAYYKIYREMDPVVAATQQVGTRIYGWIADVDGAATEYVGNQNDNLPDMAEQPPDYIDRSTLETTKTISSVAYGAASTYVVTVTTSAAHGYATGDYVWISGLFAAADSPGHEPLQISDRRFKITVASPTTFTLDNENAYLYWAHSAGASTSHRCQRYNHRFNNSGDYPSTGTIFQQRMIMAATANLPQTLWGSKIGTYDTFTTRRPVVDDEAFEFTLDSRQMNKIEWMVPLESILIGTAGGEFRMTPGSDGDAITATSVRMIPQSHWGSAPLQPIMAGDSVIFLEYGSKVIRDLIYSLEADGYRGNNLNIFATHLFEDYTIVDWAFQRNPFSILWCVRNDGKVIGLTYMKEHDVWAWHYHDFGGAVEAICCIPNSDGHDDVYMVVKRWLNGRSAEETTTRCVERLSIRMDGDDMGSGRFTDCSVTYYNPHTIVDIYVDSGQVNISTAGDPHGLSTDDQVEIRGVVGANELNGNRYYVTVQDASSFKLCTAISPSYVYVDGTLVSQYLSGGEVAKVLPLGSAVCMGPHLSNMTGLSANESGSAHTDIDMNYEHLTTTAAAAKITLGIPYTSDLETLDLVYETRGGTMRDKFRRPISVSLLVQNSANFRVGPDCDSLRSTAFPSTPYTGEDNYAIYSGAGRGTRVCIRQTDPLPVTIAALLPRLEVGGD